MTILHGMNANAREDEDDIAAPSMVRATRWRFEVEMTGPDKLEKALP